MFGCRSAIRWRGPRFLIRDTEKPEMRFSLPAPKEKIVAHVYLVTLDEFRRSLVQKKNGLLEELHALGS